MAQAAALAGASAHGLGSHGSSALYGEGSSAPLDPTDSSAHKINALGLADDGAAPGSETIASLEFEAGSGRMRLSRSQSSPPEEAWFAPLPGAPFCDSVSASD